MNKPEKKQHLSVAMLNELDKRFNDHKNGIDQSFTWEETLAMAKEPQKPKQTGDKLAKFLKLRKFDSVYIDTLITQTD